MKSKISEDTGIKMSLKSLTNILTMININKNYNEYEIM